MRWFLCVLFCIPWAFGLFGWWLAVIVWVNNLFLFLERRFPLCLATQSVSLFCACYALCLCRLCHVFCVVCRVSAWFCFSILIAAVQNLGFPFLSLFLLSFMCSKLVVFTFFWFCAGRDHSRWKCVRFFLSVLRVLSSWPATWTCFAVFVHLLCPYLLGAALLCLLLFASISLFSLSFLAFLYTFSFLRDDCYW